MKAACVAVLWLATGYRTWIVLRKGATPWRVHLAAAIGCLAIATTLFFARAEFNAWLGVPNIAALVNRVVLTGAWVAVQLYVLDLKGLTPQAKARARLVRLTMAGLVIAVMTVSWVLAPVHDRDLPDFAPVARHPAVLTYTVGYYLYVIWLLFDLGVFAHRQARGMRATDPPGALASALIAAGCYLGVPVLSLFGANVITAGAGRPHPALDRLGNLFFPVPMAVLALGLLMLPLVPQLTRRRTALRQLRDITPLWAYLVDTDPSVRLPAPGSTHSPRTHPEVTLQRRLIEVADALETFTIEPGTGTTVDTLAHALVHQRGPGPTAKQALADAAAPLDGAVTLLELGRAYARVEPGLILHA